MKESIVDSVNLISTYGIKKIVYPVQNYAFIRVMK